MWPGVLVSLLFPLIGNCQYYTAFGIHFLLSPQILDLSYAPSLLSLSSLHQQDDMQLEDWKG